MLTTVEGDRFVPATGNVYAPRAPVTIAGFNEMRGSLFAGRVATAGDLTIHYDRSVLRAGDCVVVISNSGRTRDLMDACDIARKNGATTIVITASGSPLATAGHIHLSADHPEGFDKYSPMVSRLMHLMILDILATAVALRIGSGTLQPLLSEMRKNLRSKRYA